MTEYLKTNEIYHGDARDLLKTIEPDSIACSIWSPPYHVGKSYEANMSFDDWQSLLQDVITQHYPILTPGGFLVINIADILCFPDGDMPRIQAENVSRRRVKVTTEQVLEAKQKYPHYNGERSFQSSRHTPWVPSYSVTARGACLLL
jgi:DNA modification methylase